MGRRSKRRRAREVAAEAVQKPEPASPRGCLWIAGLVTLGGCLLGFVMLREMIIPSIRSNHFSVETTCTLLDKRVHHSRRGTSYDLPNFVRGRRGVVGGTPEFQIEYRVAGETYIRWVRDDAGAFSSVGEMREFFDSLRVGETYPCWYDPVDPERAVLVRGYGFGFVFMIAIPVAFIGAGAFGLWHLFRDARGRTEPPIRPVADG